MPQLGQWLWSMPFLFVMGPSHFALRISTMVLSWLGLAAFYDQLRREGVSIGVAGLAACVLALNPLFFVSQGTYMTDVPALSFGLIALNGYTRAMGQRSLRWLAPAAGFAILGTITRQNLIAVPIVAGLLLVRFPELRLKPIWVLSVLLPVAAGVSTSLWFTHRPDVLPMQPVFPSPERLVVLPFLAVHLCGLTVLPLCLLNSRSRTRGVFAAAFVVMILAAGCLFVSGEDTPYAREFPYCPGMITVWGTSSEQLVVGHRDVLLSPALRMVISMLGCIGGARILVSLVQFAGIKKTPGPLLLFTMVQALFLLCLEDTHDRYFEVLFPGAIYLVAARFVAFRTPLRAGMVAVAMSGLLSVGLFHDWLSWNAARWDLGRQALAMQTIKPADIEGGFEWNGWYGCANPDQPLPGPKQNPDLNDASTLALPFTRDFFPNVRGQFALAFTQPSNAVVVASQRYRPWLSSGPRDFLLVRLKE